MRLSKYLAAAAVAAMTIAPAMAAPINSAAALSLAPAARAASHGVHKDRLRGRGIFIAFIAAIAIGVGIYVAVDDNSSSN